jgi:hypothetical protein
LREVTGEFFSPRRCVSTHLRCIDQQSERREINGRKEWIVEQMAMEIPVGLRSHTRGEFLRMLRQRGAKPGVNYCRFDAQTREIRDIQHVYLCCRYDQWLQAFGEPEAVSPGFDSAVGATVHTWRQPCVDGPVTCVGHLFEHPAGVRWVIVVRVCFT